MKIEIYNRAADLQQCIRDNKIKLAEQELVFKETSAMESPIPEKDILLIQQNGMPSRFTFFLKREVLLQSIQDRIDELKEKIQIYQQEFDNI